MLQFPLSAQAATDVAELGERSDGSPGAILGARAARAREDADAVRCEIEHPYLVDPAIAM